MVDYQGPPPPKGTIRRKLWEISLKIDAAFAFTLIDRWEKYLILITFGIITFVFWLSVITYYPRHLAYLSRRFSYYVFDDENVSLALVLKEWIGSEIRRLSEIWGGKDGGVGAPGSSGGVEGIKVDL